jgi:hypothetical protein
MGVVTCPHPQPQAATPAPGVKNPAKKAPSAYGNPVVLASLQSRDVDESSGIAASRRNDGVYWTHNDSGDGPYVYAFNRTGRSLGVWRVTGAQARDWEDMAVGPGPVRGRSYLYVGDIGDNERKWDSVVVYRVPEPRVQPGDAGSTKASPRATAKAEALRLRYPDGKHDAEALMVHPVTGDLYIVTKGGGTGAEVYRLKAPYAAGPVHTLKRVGAVSVPSLLGGFVTGGDISPDGRRVALCDYMGAYEYTVPPNRGFDAVWGVTPRSVNLGSRRQGEAVCYRRDGRSLLATSEKRPCPLIEVSRNR